ncbi:lysosome-associated membrane glycoprotein 1-like [Megalops cyprinoides]|uniref:lysosome-associated membrane glycoprotein 1-like n=1 Tax=Megalops cyprinoides TaxID=118141 RepID=UPI001864553A|nr:lysosome-associated membrane glycoprotein 1-like [Megalops cyprinoides]
MSQRVQQRRLLAEIACVFILGCVGVVQGVTLEVKEGNSTCIKAELSALFSVVYNVANGTRTAFVPLPDTTTVGSRSSCSGGSGAAWLVASFGWGHSLSFTFSRDNSLYRVDSLTLQYNLSDSATYPGSSSTGLVTMSTASTGILAGINTTYRCETASPVRLGGVTVIFSDMRMEAYMPGRDLSTNETICTADYINNAAALKMSITVPPPTPPAKPERGNYTIAYGNGTNCLLARMGLQLNLTYTSTSLNKTVQQLVNLQPRQTKNTGLCEENSATLWLLEKRTNLSFSFTLNSTSSKYYLSGIAVSATWPDMKEPFSGSNRSLEYLQGALGHSYMCSAEQTLSVVPGFSLNTFQVQLQPFGVNGDQFGSAEECQLDEDHMLIPIIVGATMAGLALIVLIVYLVGRKSSHTGYETI